MDTGGAVIVDAYNVVGAGGGQWWRDRPAAVQRLHRRLACYARRAGRPVEMVLDVAHPELPEGVHDGVTVHVARRRGRDAADDRIRELLAERAASGVEVVSSDRALRTDVLALGATVIGNGSFLSRLDDVGC